jgi:hypothetical protein
LQCARASLDFPKKGCETRAAAQHAERAKKQVLSFQTGFELSITSYQQQGNDP